MSFFDKLSKFITDSPESAISVLAIVAIGVISLMVFAGWIIFISSNKTRQEKAKNTLLTFLKYLYYAIITIVLVVAAVWLVGFMFRSFSNDPKTSPELQRAIIEFIGILLGAFTIAAAIAAIVINKFFQEAKESRENIIKTKRMLGLACEIALVNLPDMLETQHIPLKDVRVLQEVEYLVKKDPSLQKELDKIGNGQKLRIARAILRHATGYYTDCIKLIMEFLKTADQEKSMQLASKTRLAITYRQQGNLKKSIETFQKVVSANNVPDTSHTPDAKVFYACVGQALGYLNIAHSTRARRKEWWRVISCEEPSEKDYKECGEALVEGSKKLSEAQENMVLKSGVGVHECNFFYYYLLRFASSVLKHLDTNSREIDQAKRQTIYSNIYEITINSEHLRSVKMSARYTNLQSFKTALENLIDRCAEKIFDTYVPDRQNVNDYQVLKLVDNAIIANYYQVLFLCCILSKSSRRSVLADDLINKSEVFASQVELQGGCTIYSETEFKEVSLQQFREEIQDLKRTSPQVTLANWAKRVRGSIV